MQRLLGLVLIILFALFQANVGRAAAQSATNAPHAPGATASGQAGTMQPPNPPDYSQEAYVVEQLHTAMRYENDGTGREEQTAKFRIVSESGVQALGQVRIGYSAQIEKLDIVYVRVRKPDGTVLTAQESAVQDLTAIPSAPVYSDYHEKHVAAPSLRPGDVLEYDFVRTIINPLTPNQFWTSYNFAENGVVLDEQLEINVPKARHVTIKTRPGYDPQVSDEGDRRIYRWARSHAVDRSSKMPPRPPAGQAPAVQLTTFQSWEDVGAWYAFLEKRPRIPDDAVTAKAAELVRGKTDEMEKVKALYDFVSRNIRYVALSFGLGHVQPHAAGEVLANGYGDCKDKNTLLAALLQAEGIQSSSVLINSQRNLDPEVPSPSQFDHVITRVPVGGKEIWLDSTAGVMPFRMLMAPLRDKQALAISPDGKAALVRTPAALPFEAVDQTHAAGSLSETGKLTLKLSASMRGDREVVFRYALRQVPGNHWKDLFDNMLQRSGMRGAEISNLNVSDPSDTDTPLRVSLDASVNNYFDWSAAESKIKLPFMDMNLAGMPGVDENQDKPEKVIRLGSQGEVQVEVRLKFPENYTVHPPIAVDVRRDYAEYHSSYKLENNELISVRNLRLLQAELPFERLEDYAAFQRAVAADQAQSIVVDNKSPSAGATGAAGGNESADDLYNAGSQALSNNNYPLAIDLLQRVVKLEPRHKAAWNSLGLAYLSVNKNEQAIDALKKQIEINPYDEFAYTNLARAYEAQLNYAEAAKQYQKQIEINPLDKFAHAGLGGLYVKQKKFADAVPELEKGIALQPQNPLLQISLGQAYLATNQTEKGLAAFDKAVSLSPTPATWNNIAYTLAEQDVQLDRADKYADAAINAVETQLRDVNLSSLRFQDLGTASFLYNIWDTKGWVAFKRGDFEQARRYIEAAWLASGSGTQGEHLGEVYEKQGKREQAIHAYVLALSTVTPSDEARARLTALGVTKDLERTVEQGRAELQRQRITALARNEKGTAEYFLLLAPSGVQQVKFIKGDDSLKALSDLLPQSKITMTFPPNSQAQVPRRAVITCGAAAPASQPAPVKTKTKSKSATILTTTKPASAAGPCSLELLPADAVRAVD